MSVPSDTRAAVSTYSQATLSIPSMHCSHDEKKLHKTLISAPGDVRNIKISPILKRAVFEYDTAITSIENLLKYINANTGKLIAHIIEMTSAWRDLCLNVPWNHQTAFLAKHHPQGVEGVMRVGKNVLVAYDPMKIGARRILQHYEEFSPTVSSEPPDNTLTAGAKAIRNLWLLTAASTVLTIPVLVMTWAPLPPHPREYAIASLVLASIVQVAIAGRYYATLFSGHIEEELLIVLSTSAAYLYSVVAFAFEMAHRPLSTPPFFETSTLLVTLITVGHLISDIAQQRAVAAASIRDLQERIATIRLSDSSEKEIDVRLLHRGDKFKVFPHSRIITDGIVCQGQSTVDESTITGESRPVNKEAGSAVFAGTFNEEGELYVQVTRLPGENTISNIARLVNEAQLKKGRIQRTVDKIASWFIPVVILLAIVTFSTWLAVGKLVRKQSMGAAAVSALTYAISVLAIACPCAIVLAVPLVILVAGGVGAKLGLVVKSASAIEQAHKITHVVFDKTGTLTQVSVDNEPTSLAQGQFDIPAMVLELVRRDRHPVAQAVAVHCQESLRQRSLISSVARSRSPVSSLLFPRARGASVSSEPNSQKYTAPASNQNLSYLHQVSGVSQTAIASGGRLHTSSAPTPVSTRLDMQRTHQTHFASAPSQRVPTQAGTRGTSSPVLSTSPSSHVQMASVLNARVVIGQGIEGLFHGQPLKGGNPKWVGYDEDPRIKHLLEMGFTLFCVTLGGSLVAIYPLRQIIRPEALEVINYLRSKERDIGVSVVSGDNQGAVLTVSRKLNIPDNRVRFNYKPDQKESYIQELVAQGEKTILFCGDGLNDAQALAKAHIGVHMNNGEGLNVTADSADVILMNGSLKGLLVLRQLSKATKRRIVISFAWSFVYNVFGLLLAAGALVKVRIPPAYAGLGEAVSIVPVVLVALQLKWFKPAKK